MFISNSHLEAVFRGKIKKEFSGNSGKIYLVENDAAAPKYIAYKCCKELSTSSVEIFKEEVQKWNAINSRYIVPIYYMHVIFGDYYACMRACDGSLEEFLREKISTTAAFNYSLQIIKGLIDLKNSSIEHHQDFNPQNILFENLSRKFKDFPPQAWDPSHGYRMMISDFAMSNYYLKDQVLGKSGGKFPFKAPEQYGKSELDGFSPDSFSLGVLLCLLFGGKHPCGYSAKDILKRNSKKLKTSWEYWSREGVRLVEIGNPTVQDLAIRLLSVRPKDRPTHDECFRIIKEQYNLLHPSDCEKSIFYIDYFDKSHTEWPRGELETRFN